MINTLIFSKDGAAQLKLLLDSIKKNADGIFNINILFGVTNEDFKNGYDKLISENTIKDIHWLEEIDFKKQTVNILNSNYEFTCLFVDNDILFREIDENKIKNFLNDDNDIFCFSLKLGTNTTKCYTMNCDNVLGEFEDGGELIKWNWTKRYMDFGYPLSTSGHVFRTKDIYKLINKISFKNTKELEENLQIFDNFPKEKMASYKQSRLVNLPIETSELEQKTYKKELNVKYLNEEKISFEDMDFSNISGSHQNLKYKFRTQ